MAKKITPFECRWFSNAYGKKDNDVLYLVLFYEGLFCRTRWYHFNHIYKLSKMVHSNENFQAQTVITQWELLMRHERYGFLIYYKCKINNKLTH